MLDHSNPLLSLVSLTLRSLGLLLRFGGLKLGCSRLIRNLGRVVLEDKEPRHDPKEEDDDCDGAISICVFHDG